MTNSTMKFFHISPVNVGLIWLLCPRNSGLESAVVRRRAFPRPAAN
jgi:hypothetical protein